MPHKKPFSFQEMIDFVVRANLSDVHTAMPGIIDTFDADTQTAKVSPSIRRIFEDGRTIDIPQIISVPVQVLGGGGFSITFPLVQGDEVLLVFSERAIDTWAQSGGVQDPLYRRKHALTDAIAILGPRSNPRKLSAYSTNSLQIRSDDGSVYINVTNGAIQLEINGGGATFNSDGSVDFANGAQLTATGDFITALGRSLDTHVHTGVTTGGGTSGPPV